MNRLSNENRKTIIQLRREGKGIREIERETKHHRDTISRILKTKGGYLGRGEDNYQEHVIRLCLLIDQRRKELEELENQLESILSTKTKRP